MIIELRSEDDIWRLFGGEDHTQPGIWQQPFATIKLQLSDRTGFHSHKPDVPDKSELKKAKSKIKQRFPLKDTNRRYLLIAGTKEVCVDQSRLLQVGKSMRDPATVVQYLGISGQG